MRLRQFLIIHYTKSILFTLKRYLLTEYNDIAITEASSGKEAMGYLKDKEFQMVISAEDLMDMNGLEFLYEMHALPNNAKTPLIIVTLTGEDNIKKLLDAGVDSCLALPFKPQELKEKIDAISNPRQLRVNERFHIPKARVILHAGKQEIEAGLLNFSLGGMLCDLRYQKQPIDLFRAIYITLEIPAPNGNFETEQLRCNLARLDIVSWKSDEIADYIRLAFIFVGLSELAGNQVKQIIEMAREQKLQTLE